MAMVWISIRSALLAGLMSLPWTVAAEKPEAAAKGLIDAVRQGRLSEVRQKLPGLSPEQLNALDAECGGAPLHVAAKRGRVLIAGLLIESGAEVDREDRWGATPLYWAAWGDSPGVAGLLLGHGADVHARAGWDRATPLHRAAVWGSRATAWVLLSHGADLKAKDNVGWIPFQHAGSRALAELLIPDVFKVNARNEQGMTPLHLAVKYNKPAVMQVLLERGANVNARDDQGDTPLHECARYRKPGESLRILMAAGADLDAKIDAGQTPLEVAVADEETEMATVLRYLSGDRKKKKGDSSSWGPFPPREHISSPR